MINEINESIYNYIFSTNEEIKGEIIKDSQECRNKLDEIISKQYDVIADFWDENITDFNEKCATRIQTIGTKNASYIYINFPRMTSRTKIAFLNYKAQQILKSIQDNGSFIGGIVKKYFTNMENIGIKGILDFCEKKEIIAYKGNVYKSYDNNPASVIIYDNIVEKLGVNENILNEEDEFKTGFLITYKRKAKVFDSANAEIYEVEDENGDKYIAKILTKNISKERMKRFRNEINFGKIYKSDNVIEVIDNGIKNIKGIDYMFYIMPKYKCNFRKIMKNDINNENVLDYFNQILEGVKFIHTKKAFHRDIKPENILYDEIKDRMIISDLGIAHFSEEDLIQDPQTKLTERMANFQYAAPEQKMKGRTVDYRCDIYSLGLILNEIFTGDIIVGNKYKKIIDTNEQFGFLDSIVEKMTAQDPNDRYSSIEEIQYEINVRLESFMTDMENEALKKIIINESEEKDILMIEPMKIIDVKIDESGKLTIYLNNDVNQLWIELIKRVDKTELMGYEPEKFEFFGNTATVFLRTREVFKQIPQIVEYFKQWISSVNDIYSQEVKKIRKQEQMERERSIKATIEKSKELDLIRKQIKI